MWVCDVDHHDIDDNDDNYYHDWDYTVGVSFSQRSDATEWNKNTSTEHEVYLCQPVCHTFNHSKPVSDI